MESGESSDEDVQEENQEDNFRESQEQMFQSCPIEESIDGERDCEKFEERHSSSFAEELEAFIEDFVAHEGDEDYREDDIAVCEDADIYPVQLEYTIESED